MSAPGLSFRFLAGWYSKRVVRTVVVAVPAIGRAAVAIVREAWNEKTVVNLLALNASEENAMRHARRELAEFIGMPRLSPEEYLVLCARLADLYVNRRLEPLTKTEACRLITDRRRYRP